MQALDGAGAIITSTIASEGALLSATPRKENAAKDATGGLLRKIGERGVLVIKDVTSILSMTATCAARCSPRCAKSTTAAGSATSAPTAGGRSTWRGRIVVVGAVTTAWDTAHGVVAAMGDRFVAHPHRLAPGPQASPATRRSATPATRSQMRAGAGGGGRRASSRHDASTDAYELTERRDRAGCSRPPTS